MGKVNRAGFVSYARADAVPVERFLRLMRPRCATRRECELELWSDRLIPVGKAWPEEIQRALRVADFGLLCVSSSFLASEYVRAVELPALFNPGRVVIPVALEPLDFADGDLGGLEDRQVFRYRPPSESRELSFAECGGVNPKRFCDALVKQVVQRLLRQEPGW